MKIIIPAAGEGQRLRPHTLTKPKPLLNLAGRKAIDYLLEPLVALKPSELIVVVGYRKDQLLEHIRNNYDFHLTAVEQEHLAGLGYAIHLALEAAGDSEPILIVLADTLAIFDYERFMAAGETVIALKEVTDPRRFGVAVVENKKITALEEKPEQPKSSLAVVGVYYFQNPALLRKTLSEHVAIGKKTAGEIQFTDALATMIANGATLTPFVVDEWLDCGKKETMLSTNGRLNAQLPEEARLQGNLDRESKILGAGVWIAPSGKISNSTIGPNVSIYENTVIERSTLRNAIVGANCRISDCNLDGAIIGERVELSNSHGNLDIGDDDNSNNQQATIVTKATHRQ